MGSRANYVLLDDRGWSLRYSHWGASAIDRDLAWGPDHAAAFIRAQHETAEWLDEVWCEGAALVDLPRKRLIFFGGDDPVYNAPLLRLELAVFARLWPGWSVRWAAEGLGELVDHLGLDRARVRSGREDDAQEPPELQPEWPEGLWSVRGRDGALRLYALNLPAHGIGQRGPDLLAQLDALGGAPALRTAIYGESVPRDGVHLDVGARTIDLWTPTPVQDLAAQVARRWPGWRFTHHGLAWESQQASAGEALDLAPPSRAEVEQALLRRLGRGAGVDPEQIRQAVIRAHGGQDLDFNPSFSAHVRMDVTEESRAELLAWALGGIQGPDGFGA